MQELSANGQQIHHARLGAVGGGSVEGAVRTPQRVQHGLVQIGGHGQARGGLHRFGQQLEAGVGVDPPGTGWSHRPPFIGPQAGGVS